MTFRMLIFLVSCAVLAVAGCGSDSSATYSADADARSKPAVPQGPTAEKLIVNDLEEGTGAVAEKGDTLILYYVGGVYETGDEIESGWVKGNPFGVRLGAGGFLAGWEEGLKGMRVGGRRELIFPTTPDDAPPGSELGDTLVYIIDLVELEKSES